MKVEYTNPNIIVSTSRKQQFQSNPANKALATVKSIDQDETKYSKAASIGAIAVLAGLGLAMFHKINNLEITGRKIMPYGHECKHVNMPNVHGGPTIDITKGKTAIADAWNGYISEIEERIQGKHAQVKKLYSQLFNKSAEQLDKYEAIADERLANNTGSKFVRCA